MILSVVAFMFIADVLGFMAWILSGQMPLDNFYIGAITAHILGAIL